MTAQLSIEADWESAAGDSPEVRETAALLSISCGEFVATRVDDDWSGSVRDRARVSAYPLALWLAASWWRLLNEPAFEGEPSPEWLMSHDVAAAGYGYLWPTLRFACDDENFDIDCAATSVESRQPVRYLTNFHTSFSREDFVAGVDEFVQYVLTRLDDRNVRNTDLHALWRDLVNERNDVALSDYRRLEARLGCDPDEAPERALEKVHQLGERVGYQAVSEVAPLCAGLDPIVTLGEIEDLSQSGGIRGRFPERLPIAAEWQSMTLPTIPWERGYAAARYARSAIGLEAAPISDRELSSLFHVSRDRLIAEPLAAGRRPLGMAYKDNHNDYVYLFHRRNRLGRRFEAARFLADHLVAPSEDAWLPVTDTKTVRQKYQRAFAAEFLCPIDALRAYVDDDFSDDALDAAGQHFDVSTRAILTHLVNNHVLPRERLNVSTAG